MRQKFMLLADDLAIDLSQVATMRLKSEKQGEHEIQFFGASGQCLATARGPGVLATWKRLTGQRS